MRIRSVSAHFGLPVFAIFLFLGACAVSLVPQYDPSLVDGLNKANEETLMLFSSLAGGSPKSKFSEFSNKYDTVIGKFDALRMQAAARATPPLAKKVADQLAKFKVVKDVCSGDSQNVNSCVNSSPRAMETIVKNLSKMRDRHRDKGLPTDLIPGFRNAHDTSIQQALTVELALKRD